MSYKYVSGMAEIRYSRGEENLPGLPYACNKAKAIQDDPWQKIYPKRDGKQHLFSSLAMFHGNENLLKLSFIQVTRSEGKIKGVLELENTDIPHSVPTGDYGYREVIVTTELLDKTGQIIDLKKESLFIELKTALPYKGKKMRSLLLWLE